VVYTPEQAGVVETIIGEEMDEQVAWQNTLVRSKQEAELTDTTFPEFNMAVANYYLGNYEQSIADYESVASALPRRMLWYQLEPILAMQKLGQYDKIMTLSERILNGGNRAFSELYQVRGEVYLARGNRDAARAEFEKAVEYNVNYQPARDALLPL
jgi:tetratricopeptide (TPR) repeat protein